MFMTTEITSNHASVCTLSEGEKAFGVTVPQIQSLYLGVLPPRLLVHLKVHNVRSLLGPP